MLFAAGFGTRMGDLTKDCPKPLIKVAGKTLFDHAYDPASAVADTIVANTHYLTDQMQVHLKSRGVRISHEEPEILETGGGLRQALPLLGGGPVYTSNTDAVWKGPNPFEVLRDVWNPDLMDALLLCIPKENAVGHAGNGDFEVNADGQISRGPGVIYTGVQILKTDRLADIPETAFSLNVLWNEFIAKGRAYAAIYPGQWCDVGRPEGIALAEMLLGAEDV